VRAEDVELDEGGRGRFRLATPYGSADVALQVRGEHAVFNALAAAAAVLGSDAGSSATGDAARVAALLSAAVPVSRWRMEVTERADGVTVVNDAYNANPESMRAALKTLAVMSEGKRRRTVAVLGHMAELGGDAREAHMDLGRFLVRLDVGQLVVVGEAAGGIHAGAVLEGSWGSESIHVPDVDAAVALLREQLEPGDVVLVKGSRSGRAGARRCGPAGAGPVRIGTRGPVPEQAARPPGDRSVRSVLIAAMTALIVSLLCTPAVVRLFRRRGYGQEIREDGPEQPRHQARHADHGRRR
jgi:UDP-N-acetylmuramoyl-tripeptide--D-alanyl-D-alanine ligase